jgi:outer membrane protein TolC
MRSRICIPSIGFLLEACLEAARLRFYALLMLALLLSSCAWFSPDGGMKAVSDIAAQDIGKDAAAIRNPDEAFEAHTVVARLLGRPLTANAAVQIALLNNRGLQASYNELAIAEAQRVGASLPPSPTFSLFRVSGSVETEMERQLVIDIVALAALPAASEIATTRFHQAQLRAAEDTLRIAAQTRRAYYRAVAAREFVDYLMQTQTAAETSAKFAHGLGESGAMNKLDQAREQAFYAEVTAQLATAREVAAGEREALVRLMGLWGDDLRFKLPTSLPPLPAHVKNLAGIELEAVGRRVDLQISRLETEALARSYGLTKATRFVSIFDAGPADKTIIDKQLGQTLREPGFALQLQVPLFDFGEARLREAEASYMRSVNRLLDRAVTVRSEARDAYRTYRSSYDIAMHYRREVLPLRKIISDETLLRYNAMLIDVFALLVEARQRISINLAAVDAQRAFWLATVDLNTAAMGGGVVGVKRDEPRATLDAPGGDQ